jgi:hypothetical protein
MTEKTYREKVIKLGGIISDPSCEVSFPDKFRINNKVEALDVLDILIQDVHPAIYSVEDMVPLQALKTAIKKGLI